ncbi:hypothetical protein [Georgenia wangjunii]|uniref:hypothetical protein n=1 Tax=Georgenia wangjunii TaxID=3117730 RepID=UPI002F26BCE3
MNDSRAPESTARVLAEFFSAVDARANRVVRAHAGAVQQHLDVYLDTEAERVLTTDELALVEAERQIDPVAAVARVTGPEALVAALPGFVDAAWLLPAQTAARAQVRLVEALVAWLEENRHVDRHAMACFLLEVDAACRRARSLIAAPAARGPG